MSDEIKLEFNNGNETVFYSKYFNNKYNGYDRVLQHQLAGVETAHVTIHPGSKPQVTEKKSGTKKYLINVVNTKLLGFKPATTPGVVQFFGEVSEVVASS